jgi:hypothetical protein
MKKPVLIVVLILLTAIIVYIVIGDLRSTRIGNRPGNIYELDVEQFKTVDPSLISHRETRNYTLDAARVSGLAYADKKLYLAADRYYQVFDLDGRLLLKVDLPDSAICIDVADDGSVILGFSKYLSMFNDTGEPLWTSEPLGARAVITAVAVKSNLIFVADAGSRCIHRFNTNGSKIDHFEGKTGSRDLHGFIVPSANFDIDINAEGELWVVNPGKHALENYTDEGELRGYWENSSVKVEGFSGCCNPAHFTFLPDGSYITSEKGMVRIKIHKPSGEFLSVVAPPVLFAEEGKAPDVVCDEEGRIYALDYEKKMIRLFEQVNQP